MNILQEFSDISIDKIRHIFAVSKNKRTIKLAAGAMVRKAEGAVVEVESYMNERTLISPINGEVAERFPEIGELVGAGEIGRASCRERV